MISELLHSQNTYKMIVLNPYRFGDTDAINFCNIAGIDKNKVYFNGTVYQITGQEIFSAINSLVIDLKNAGLWAKQNIWYPIVGDTLASKSINLINPLSYSLSYVGTIENLNNGIRASDTTSMADTNFAGTLIPNNCHICAYSQNSGRYGISGNFDFASYNRTRNKVCGIGIYRLGSPATFSDIWEDGTLAYTNSINDGLGLILGNRQSVNVNQLWDNGIKLITNTVTTFYDKSANSVRFFIGITGRILSHGSIGAALSDEEVVIKTNIIKKFETAMKRNVL